MQSLQWANNKMPPTKYDVSNPPKLWDSSLFLIPKYPSSSSLASTFTNQEVVATTISLHLHRLDQWNAPISLLLLSWTLFSFNSLLLMIRLTGSRFNRIDSAGNEFSMLAKEILVQSIMDYKPIAGLVPWSCRLIRSFILSLDIDYTFLILIYFSFNMSPILYLHNIVSC